MSAGKNKDVDALLRRVLTQPDWRRVSRRRHHKLRSPAGVMVPVSTSDRRCVANLRSELRRTGAQLD
jgi:hypothetical protein